MTNTPPPPNTPEPAPHPSLSGPPSPPQPQPLPAPSPYVASFGPPPGSSPTRKPRPAWLKYGLAGLAGLIVGASGATGAASGGGSATPNAAATATVTATVTQVSTVTVEAAAPSPAAPDPATYTPKKTDFKLTVKVLEKSCFGSAGCNVTARIEPSYVGATPLPTSGTVEVTYRWVGPEDTKVSTFTIDGDGTAHFDGGELLSVPSSGTKLSVVITDVSYRG